MAWLMIALGAGLAGLAAVYLTSPHQRWLARRWPVPARAPGLAAWALSLPAWWMALRPLAAVFAFIAWSMLLLTLLPALGAWRQATAARKALVANARGAGRSVTPPEPEEASSGAQP